MPRTLFSTALGTCGIAWSETGITRFCLPGPDEELRERLGPGDGDTEIPPAVAAAIAMAKSHLEGDLQDFSVLVLDTRGVSPFELGVYRLTSAVPAGQVTTYGRIASGLGLGPGASRAVGTALGSNPWPLIVPCHRVVAASGKMTGFSAPGGVLTKTRLLALEGAELLSE